MLDQIAVLEQKIETLLGENTQLKFERTHLKQTQNFQHETIESQDQTIEFQNQAIEALKEEIAEAQQKYENLILKFRMARRQQFGSISERFIDGSDQLPLFDLPKTEPPKETEDIAYTRVKPKRGSKTEHIPQREVIIPVENKTCECGHERVVIDYETKHLLHYIPAVIELLIQKREVVACNYCDKGIETAPAPKQLLPKCKASESLLAHIAVSKILDRHPLYHIEKILDRDFGWHIKRATMARWMIQMGDALQPLVNLLKDQVYKYDIASADATSLQVLKTPTKSPQSKSTAYCIRGGPPGQEVVLFDYLDIAQDAFLIDTFGPFKGTLMVDGATCFNKLADQFAITLSNCHAHCRRKFERIFKATKKKGTLAKVAMQFYRDLYKIERDAKDKNYNPDQLLHLRQERSAPLLAKFKEWLDYHHDKTPPKSPIHKAIAYALTYWDGLQVFLTNPRLQPDNNATEREIKTFVLSRKNFLFCDTQPGADALGALFSIILTARMHGHNPRSYFQSVLKRTPHCYSLDDFEALLPWNLKPDLLT